MNLPIEIVTEIARQCDGATFIRFGQTCSLYALLLSESTIWDHILKNVNENYKPNPDYSYLYLYYLYTKMGKRGIPYMTFGTFGTFGTFSRIKIVPFTSNYVIPTETPDAEDRSIIKSNKPIVRLTQKRFNSIVGKMPKWMYRREYQK